MSFVIGGLQRGVSPLIATILLLLLVSTLGVIFASWARGFWNRQQQPIDTISQETVECSSASFMVRPDEKHCFYYSASGQAKVIVENSGDTDLNTFRVTSLWADGTSDLNTVTLDLEEHQTGVAWTKAKASKEMPVKIRIDSVDCPALYTIIKTGRECKVE